MNTNQADFPQTKIVFILPTKDRQTELRNALKSLAAQSRPPDNVVIVDAGQNENIPSAEFPGLEICHVHYTGMPSAAAQRNAGIAQVPEHADYVVFFDDDQILLPDALEKMLAFLESNPAVGGAAFYLPPLKQSMLKQKLKCLCRRIGLYPEAGGVAPSGWQGLPEPVETPIRLSWAGSGALALRRDVLKEFHFDPWFQGYSYLEDLDFTYSISRKYPLYLVPAAKFEHHHSQTSRPSPYQFGQMEVRNRLYFVRKHNFSRFAYGVTMFLRWGMSVGSGQFARAWGNITGALTER